MHVHTTPADYSQPRVRPEGKTGFVTGLRNSVLSTRVPGTKKTLGALLGAEAEDEHVPTSTAAAQERGGGRGSRSWGGGGGIERHGSGAQQVGKGADVSSLTPGTRFTCFTGTKVQTLTLLSEGTEEEEERQFLALVAQRRKVVSETGMLVDVYRRDTLVA